MNENLVELFLEEDCDQHAQSVFLTSIRSMKRTGEVEDFTLNRFNVRLDFKEDQAIIDDDLNPDYGGFRLPLDDFASRVSSVFNT